MKTTTRILGASLLSLSLACTPSNPPVKNPEPSTKEPATTTAVEPRATEEKAAPPEGEVLAADTPLTMTSGATFIAPGGWSATNGGDIVTLVEPGGELSLVFIELTAQDAASAASAAWKKFKPDFARKVKETISVPVSDGWDEIVQVVYDIPSQEAKVAVAVARRKGGMWYVALFDGAIAALDRRSAQAMTALGSFKAVGIEEESFAGKEAHPLEGEKLAAFEEFIEEARQKAGIPGVAVAVVQGGKVVFEKGFGVKESGKKGAVTPNTLFMIGSTTKSLTSLMMAALVDEGKLSWETPVVDILPSFALADPEATRQLTVKHTVCACTGLPRQDMEFLFEFSGVTPEKRLEEMKSMTPTTGFGETFQYSNSLVSAGGYIAARAIEPEKKLQDAYLAAMKGKVFGPLGMKSTTFEMKVAKKADHASPHGRNIKNEFVALPLSYEEAVVSVAPAGGAWSNLRDLTRYMLFELAKGKTPEGKQIVSEENLLARRVPQVKINNKFSYGLGFMVGDYLGLPLVEHSGNTLGFSTKFVFFPAHDLGLVVLANSQAANSFTGAIQRRLVELLFDGEEKALERYEFTLGREKEATDKNLAEINLDPDKEWLSKFVGAYKSPSLGKLTLTQEKGRFILDAGEWKSAVAEKKESDGTRKIVVVDAPLAGLDFFAVEEEGKPSLVLNAGQLKYTFEAAEK